MKILNLGMTLVMLAIFVVLVTVASGYPADARFMPFVVGIPAIGLCLLQLALDLRRRAGAQSIDSRGTLEIAQEPMPAVEPEPQLSTRETVRREVVMWGYFLAFIASILLFGYWVTIPLFLVTFLRWKAKSSWRTALILGIAATGILFLAFEKGFRMELHPGFLTEYLWNQIQE